MIGCLILGSLVALGTARLIRHRYHCGWGGRHHPFGPFGGGDPRWHAMHGHHGHHWYGHGGGHGPTDHENGHGSEAPWPGDSPDGEHFAPDRPGRWGGRGFMGAMVGHLVRHVRATATQEGVIRAAFDEFRTEMKDVGGGERKKTRQDVSAALRKPQFDEVFMGELFARQDTAIERARKAFVGLMAKVHDVLDEEQRGRLADLVEKGPRFWRGGLGW